jgi:hypothetical protein
METIDKEIWFHQTKVHTLIQSCSYFNKFFDRCQMHFTFAQPYSPWVGQRFLFYPFKCSSMSCLWIHFVNSSNTMQECTSTRAVEILSWWQFLVHNTTCYVEVVHMLGPILKLNMVPIHPGINVIEGLFFQLLLHHIHLMIVLSQDLDYVQWFFFLSLMG